MSLLRTLLIGLALCRVANAQALSKDEAASLDAEHLTTAERLYVENAMVTGKDEWAVLKRPPEIDWKRGNIGMMHFDDQHVQVRVIDGKSMVVTTMTFVRGTAFQPSYDKPKESFLITGLDTSNIADDADEVKIPLGATFVYMGVEGRVKHLEAIDLEKMTPIVDRLLESRSRRTWAIGNRCVRGKMTSSPGAATVRLELPDGEKVSIKRTQLKPADREWLEGELKRRREKAKAAS
jgi:hypothetical protein